MDELYPIKKKKNFLYIHVFWEKKEEKFLKKGQEEDHTLEDSICRPLIGKQIYKPYFHYCKLCPKVEFLPLESMENHIRLKDPELHKAKLLEFLEKKE